MRWLMTPPMKHHEQGSMRLYSTGAQRLYLNKSERLAFKRTAGSSPPKLRFLCLMLLHTGCRLSEALNIKSADIQWNEGIVAIRSLKKRNQHHVRELPVPQEFLDKLKRHLPKTGDQLIWPQHRSTAWRQIKQVMALADIIGMHATPKGLRHSFGVHCAFSNIPMPLAQKWMGHATLSTTAIYYQIIGKEEREMAGRMW